MPYCTLNDIRAQLPESNIVQLTDDEGFGVIDQLRVGMAISVADSIINGYLGGRYTLPLETVPDLIKTIAIDITIYKLYERRLELEMPESMLNRYKNAVRLLEYIQKGTVSIDVQEEGEEAGYYKTNKTLDDRMFDKAKLSQL